MSNFGGTMDFGEWVHKIRTQQNLDVRSFAEKTGVDGSTISRIENAKTQSTLYTAFRICEGLQVPLPILIHELKGTYPSIKQSLDETKNQVRESNANYATQREENRVVTINDIEIFIDSFYKDRTARKEDLAKHLNYIVASDIDSQLEHPQENFFVPEDIEKLLLNSPVYQFELQYPSELSAEAILAIYKQSGAMTLTDIGVYTRKIRTEKKVSLEKLENIVKISSSVLSRLETGALDRIKFADILILDEQLEQGWTIISMYWEACKFQEKFLYRHHHVPNERITSSPGSFDDVEFKLASVYITVYRWLYYFSLPKEIIHQW